MFDLHLMILLILDQLTDWFGNILKIVRNVVTMTQSDVIISFYMLWSLEIASLSVWLSI